MTLTLALGAAPTPAPTNVATATNAVVASAAPTATSSPSASAPSASTASPTATTTTTAAPVVAATPAGPGTSPTAAWIGFTGVLLVAVILALWNVVLARRKTREEERARQRTAFADALRSVVEYKEMPYAIRRRDGAQPAAERVRLSEIVREIQADLSYHQSWIRSECAAVAAAYDALVAQTRTVAGSAMRDAWLDEPITGDAQMNIGPELVDVRSLRDVEDAYAAAVAEHLKQLTPWWCR